MQISDILRHKGTAVVTITADGSVTDLLALLAQHNVGAVVVVDTNRPVGIVSERDVVRALHHRDGLDVLSGTVADIMTTSVVSCAAGDPVDSIASTMTDRRIRHMPVIDGDALAGIVTIGDVVSSQIRQLELDRGQLEQYING